MNEQHARRLGLALAAVALLAIAAATTLAGPGPEVHREGALHGGPGDTGMFLEHMTIRLELTDAQRAEAERIVEERQPVFEALHERMVPARQALFEAIHADALDEGAVRAAAAGVAVVDAEFAVARATLLQSVLAILTREQREAAKEMIGEAREFHADHPGGAPGFHGGPHRHPHRTRSGS